MNIIFFRTNYRYKFEKFKYIKNKERDKEKYNSLK